MNFFLAISVLHNNLIVLTTSKLNAMCSIISFIALVVLCYRDCRKGIFIAGLYSCQAGKP